MLYISNTQAILPELPVELDGLAQHWVPVYVVVGTEAPVGIKAFDPGRPFF